MQTPLERVQGKTLKEIGHVLRSCFSWNARGVSIPDWRRIRIVEDYSKGDESKKEEMEALLEWAMGSPSELELHLARKSPSTISQWAVRHGRRLCPDAEVLIKNKAKDKVGLLDYCTHFGILLDDVAKITLKAAFGEQSPGEQAYIRKIEHTKGKVKEFLEQMVGNGNLDPGTSVKDLLETL